ncbi:MAG: MBL fold metallo-hydrolase [Anaerolineae bacterium]
MARYTSEPGDGLQQIAPGVYVHTGYEGANVGCILTDVGAIVVDTPLIPEEGKAWAAEVLRLAKRVLYVFNTDHHRAHIMGNQYFDAPVIAHELAWKEMSSYRDAFIERTKNLFKHQPEIVAQFDEVVIKKPEITFTGRLIIKKGGREVHFVYLGGHTAATCGVWLPKERIFFTGDVVVVGEHPSLGQSNSKDWLDTLARLRRMSLNTIVPGHGPLCNVEATQPISEYIRLMRLKVRSQIKAGRSKSEAATVVSQMIDHFPYRPGDRSFVEKRIRAGVNRIYDEIKAAYEEKGGAGEEDALL